MLGIQSDPDALDEFCIGVQLPISGLDYIEDRGSSILRTVSGQVLRNIHTRHSNRYMFLVHQYAGEPLTSQTHDDAMMILSTTVILLG